MLPPFSLLNRGMSVIASHSVHGLVEEPLHARLSLWHYQCNKKNTEGISSGASTKELVMSSTLVHNLLLSFDMNPLKVSFFQLL